MKMTVKYSKPGDRLRRAHIHRVEIPESCNARALKNHWQSLSMLECRGGVDVVELYAIVMDLTWPDALTKHTPQGFIDWLHNRFSISEEK